MYQHAQQQQQQQPQQPQPHQQLPTIRSAPNSAIGSRTPPSATKKSPSSGNNATTSSSNNNNNNASGIIANTNATSAVPTLKVMRLQSPDLGMSCGMGLDGKCLLGSSLTLPDAFGVIHIGETFSAYLGALNVSSEKPVLGLTVVATLQTPSRRYPLPSALDKSNNNGGVDVCPNGFIDTIVSRTLEEVGQHILRVEVGYNASTLSTSIGGISSSSNQSNNNTASVQPKTLRKFYRFNVSSPLHIRELTLRGGDSTCFVSIAIENATTNSSLVIENAEFQPPHGLTAEPIFNKDRTKQQPHDENHNHTNTTTENIPVSAVTLFDRCGKLPPGASQRFLFTIKASSRDATLRGIACGDELGKAVFSWRKSFGEVGRIASASVLCPPGLENNNYFTSVNNRFVVHGSGLSVDAAAAAANRSAGGGGENAPPPELGELFPVTVEPIEPPDSMVLGVPREVQLLIVNHSDKVMNLQLQMRLSHMSGVVVCGSSFKNLGEVLPGGGSVVVTVRLVALVGGLFRVQGCWIVDLTTGREIAQPALWGVFVERGDDNDHGKGGLGFPQ